MTRRVAIRRSADWWLPSGITPGDCFGVYQGKGAASYESSKINLNDPGMHSLIRGGSVNLDWTPEDGWSNGGQTSFFRMDGGCYPTHEWSYMIEVRNAQSTSQQFCGQSEDPQHLTSPLGTGMNNTGAFMLYNNFGVANVGGVIVDGNVALAGKKAYRNGAHVGTCAAGTGQALYDWYWFTSNWAGATHGGQPGTIYVALAIWTKTLDEDQVATVAAAMGAL